jgi:hypothetical protein
MGETVREHAKIQGFILRALALQVLLCDTERGGLFRATYCSVWTRGPSTMFSPTPTSTKGPPRSGTASLNYLEKVRYFLFVCARQPRIVGIIFVEGAQHRQQVGIPFPLSLGRRSRLSCPNRDASW